MTESIAPGEVVADKYRVERVLGRGGMGVVVAARHLDLDQRVAIKVLRQDLLGGDEATLRFQREARALAKLGSEHVVRVSDVGRLPSGAPYMVMEYLEGKDLASVLKERGPLPVADVADYLIQACAGLSEAHSAGLVHRDLKPANLFLVSRSDGATQIKVLDFGIAKSAGDTRLTADRMVLGSPRYMSPEQVRAPREVDARTDIWALGAIAHRLLTDRAPFEAQSLEAQLEAMLAGRRESLSSLRAELPTELVSVVDRCLAPLAADRFQNVGELARALAPFGPPGSVERAARVARVSGPPPGPAAAATVPLRAVLEPTVDDPEAGVVAAATTPSSASGTPATPGTAPSPSTAPAPQAAPPRPSLSRWLLIGAALLLITLGVLFTSGALGMLTGIFAQTEVLDAPLSGVNPRAFDPVEVLPAAKALAKRLEPRAELAGIEVVGGARGGLANAETNQIDFEFDYGGDAEGFVVVRVMPTKLLASRTPIPGARKPLPDPACNARRAAEAAVRAGVPADAAPDFHYGAREGVASWRLDVPNRPELSREIDARTCAIVPISP